MSVGSAVVLLDLRCSVVKPSPQRMCDVRTQSEVGSRIKDIGSKDLKGMLDLARCRGALGLSIPEIILVSLESKLGLNMYGNSIKNDPNIGSGGVLVALGSSWDALGSSGWVLGGILVDFR